MTYRTVDEPVLLVVFACDHHDEWCETSTSERQSQADRFEWFS
jgi:hypothetical protein